MHPYSTDSSERRNVPLVLAGIAALLAWLLHLLLVHFDIHAPWWLDMPSLAGFFGLLMTWFDKRLWRAGLLRRLGVIRTPDLNGTWSGMVGTSYDNFASPRKATLTIHQTWQRIRIELTTDTSHSASRSASMTIKPPRNVIVTYSYTNDPRPDAPDSMHAFHGTATQTLSPGADRDTFDGDFYTGRDRGTFGTLNFSRSQMESTIPPSTDNVERHQPRGF